MPQSAQISSRPSRSFAAYIPTADSPPELHDDNACEPIVIGRECDTPGTLRYILQIDYAVRHFSIVPIPATNFLLQTGNIERYIVELFSEIMSWTVMPHGLRARVQDFQHGVEIYRPSYPRGWHQFTPISLVYIPRSNQTIRLREAQVIDLTEEDDEPSISAGDSNKRRSTGNGGGPYKVPRLF